VPVVCIQEVTVRDVDADRFYALLDDLCQQLGGPRQLLACDRFSGWPLRGVYFFFETGEYRREGRDPRVVRVGSHGLNARTQGTPHCGTGWPSTAVAS